jgi:hypothetical protein
VTFFINYFQGATKATLGAADEQQSANGVDGGTLATDDFAHVGGMDPEFVNGETVVIDRGDSDCIRAVHQALNHVIEKGFHR